MCFLGYDQSASDWFQSKATDSFGHMTYVNTLLARTNERMFNNLSKEYHKTIYKLFMIHRVLKSYLTLWLHIYYTEFTSVGTSVWYEPSMWHDSLLTSSYGAHPPRQYLNFWQGSVFSDKQEVLHGCWQMWVLRLRTFLSLILKTRDTKLDLNWKLNPFSIQR